MLKGIGYAICIIDVYVGMFYNTVIGWAVYYFVQSIMSAAQYTYSDQVDTEYPCWYSSVLLLYPGGLAALDILRQRVELQLQLRGADRGAGEVNCDNAFTHSRQHAWLLIVLPANQTS